jgi:hypothetical protein
MKVNTVNNTLRTTSVTHSFDTLWQWLMVKPGHCLPTAARQAKSLRPVVSTSPGATASKQSHQPVAIGQQTMRSRPVRVLQVMDIGQSRAQSGRLRISGRMADVCAELDRLAAREALQH